MLIDVRIGGARSQFASQVAKVTPEMIIALDIAFVGDETPDFYEGLLAGYVALHQIVAAVPPNEIQNHIAATIAYISAGAYKR